MTTKSVASLERPKNNLIFKGPSDAGNTMAEN